MALRRGAAHPGTCSPRAGGGKLEPPGLPPRAAQSTGRPVPVPVGDLPQRRGGAGAGGPGNAGRDGPARGRGSAARSALYRGAERARCSLPVAGPRAGRGRTGRWRAGRQRRVQGLSSACVTEAGRGAAGASGSERDSSAAGPP